MTARQCKPAELQIEAQQRRQALLDQGVPLQSDDQLRNKGGRRTEAKKQLLDRMTESALGAFMAPAKRYI